MILHALKIKESNQEKDPLPRLEHEERKEIRKKYPILSYS